MRSSISAKCASSAPEAPKNISPSSPKMRMWPHGSSPGSRSWISPAFPITNSESSMRPARGTVSRNERNTPIRTQNSIEIATAANAVAATIAASKCVVRTW